MPETGTSYIHRRRVVVLGSSDLEFYSEWTTKVHASGQLKALAMSGTNDRAEERRRRRTGGQQSYAHQGPSYACARSREAWEGIQQQGSWASCGADRKQALGPSLGAGVYSQLDWKNQPSEERDVRRTWLGRVECGGDMVGDVLLEKFYPEVQ
jgi:hypothetical protein